MSDEIYRANMPRCVRLRWTMGGPSLCLERLHFDAVMMRILFGCSRRIRIRKGEWWIWWFHFHFLKHWRRGSARAIWLMPSVRQYTRTATARAAWHFRFYCLRYARECARATTINWKTKCGMNHPVLWLRSPEPALAWYADEPNAGRMAEGAHSDVCARVPPPCEAIKPAWH